MHAEQPGSRLVTRPRGISGSALLGHDVRRNPDSVGGGVRRGRHGAEHRRCHPVPQRPSQRGADGCGVIVRHIVAATPVGVHVDHSGDHDSRRDRAPDRVPRGRAGAEIADQPVTDLQPAGREDRRPVRIRPAVTSSRDGAPRWTLTTTGWSPRAGRWRGSPTTARTSSRTRGAPVSTTTGIPQSCWCTWHAGLAASPSSQDAARALTCRMPSPALPSISNARLSRSPAPAPSRIRSGGVETTTRRTASPYRSSRCCPGGGVKATSSRSEPAGTGVGARTAAACSESRRTGAAVASTVASRCPADSATISRLAEKARSAGSARPVTSVLTVPSSGSIRRTAPL